jgi:hypothetical protein
MSETMKIGIAVGIARGHVVLEVALTPEDIQRIAERGSFVYLMSHGYAEKFGVAIVKASVLARIEREQIEAEAATTQPVEGSPP